MSTCYSLKLNQILLVRYEMVRMKRTRKVLRGRGPWSFLDMLMNYKRDFNHSINEHVDHVVNMIKSLEVEYIFQLGYKKRILQMSLTESEPKVLF